jgi:hypothetical protein
MTSVVTARGLFTLPMSKTDHVMLANLAGFWGLLVMSEDTG